MSNVLKIVTTILFDADSIGEIVASLLYIAGLWKILEKSGLKGWRALIPWVREYEVSRCAKREPEGRVFCFVSFLITMLNVFMIVSDRVAPVDASKGITPELPSTGTIMVLFVLNVALALVAFVYCARIFAGLAEMYGRKKIWDVLWVFSSIRFIPALLWGFKKEYQPAMQASDIKAEMARLATHGRVEVMDEGLTVNLKERSVHEFLNKKVLLKDIHMSIPQGHMVLLLGGSGAGKSTYVNAINGYEKAKAEVMLNRRNMYTQYDKMQYEVGFVPQMDMLRGKDKVLTTLLDAAKLRLPMDVDARQRRARVDEVMEIFGLTEVQDNLVEKLSGGQRKRLSISIEFLSNPSLFILDEPDSGLDAVMARELFTQLRRIADDGKIVIAISHTPDRVIDLFDDVIVLAKDSTGTGRLAWYGSVEDARVFFGRQRMEEIVKAVNQKSEGGEGLADEFVMRYAEVQHA